MKVKANHDQMCMNNPVHFEGLTIPQLRKKTKAHQELFGSDRTQLFLLENKWNSNKQSAFFTIGNVVRREDGKIVGVHGGTLSGTIAN